MCSFFPIVYYISLSSNLQVMLLLLLFFLLLPAISLSDNNPNTCHPDDIKALLKIKNAFTNPNPLPSITPNMTNCCDILHCDENNRINEFSNQISGGGDLAGNIPDAIGNLKYLRVIRLHKLPLLVGPIPRSITELKSLAFLDISWTSVSGPVPDFLSELKNLQIVNLSFNNLSGSIPSSLATLPNLFGLDISRNKLTGSLPESFAHFPVTTNNLQIRLSHNMLSGEIPKSFAFKKFYGIDISRNNFSGDASMLFGKINGSQVIDISRNNFEFNLSNVVFNDGMFALDVSHNKIYGGIPPQITEAIYLQMFNVSYNRLCGEIPTGWKLRYRSEPFDNSSYIHNRCLCGTPLDECKP